MGEIKRHSIFFPDDRVGTVENIFCNPWEYVCVCVCVCVCKCTAYDIVRIYVQIQDHDPEDLQCVAVCCSVLQCVAVCCRVLQGVAGCESGIVLKINKMNFWDRLY